ncbi:envelope stress response membrane protein PspB [Emcibacter sp.]|uniref:envelope stress response membrane protein PspB n=1 Tax=Emcibacter sp. TaxID=1979954 RepID=UPI002AA6BD81|nr:envelope stress response membrane protein PspB [Emcibacter sp.]
MAEVFGILFLTICAPLWIIFHYITKWKSAKTLTSEDEQILSDLYESAEKIESRLNNIERILDAESPDWRTK